MADISELILLLVELDVTEIIDLHNYLEVFETKILLTCNKLGVNYETITNYLKFTTDLYFSDTSSPEWNNVLIILFIFKRIDELNAQSKELLSVKHNKILRDSVKNLCKIGIYSKLQPKLPGYIAIEYVENSDIFYAYNILKCTSFTLCKFIDCSTLRIPILSEGLRAILLALYQIGYCPLKVTNERINKEKNLAIELLKNLPNKIHPNIFVKEIMALAPANSPAWFKKAVFQTLNDTMVSKNGVEIISTAILDGAINDKTQSWKAIDVISKIILSCQNTKNFKSICNQVFELLDKLNENSLVYERIFINCIKEINNKNSNLDENVFVQKLFDDLKSFTSKEYVFQNEDVTEKVTQILRLIYTLFVEKGVENPNLPTKSLIKYLDVIFKFHILTNDSQIKTSNTEAKEILLKSIKDNTESTFAIFDCILFDINSVIIPVRNDIMMECKENRILVTKSNYSVTHSFSEKADVIMKLAETDIEVLLRFFGYLLNCIAEKEKYFKEINKDLLLDQEEIINNLFERKIVVYKLLSEIAENKKVQNEIVKNPQSIITFFQNILKNSIRENEHRIMDSNNDKFQSLFTIVMILQALISLGSKNKYNDYQKIIDELKTIQKETQHMELKALIKHILVVIEDKDDKINLNEKGDKKSKLDEILEELCDPLLPVRGHALLSLAKLVEQEDSEVLKRKQYILTIFQQNLKNEDSFIYLRAINGLVAFVNIVCHTESVLTTLCEEYSDFSRNDKEGSETRMKLGEVLVKVTRMLGDAAPKYKALLLNTFLAGTKDDDPLIRASSLSNLGEVCQVLGYKLGTVVREILVCVHDTISYDKSVEARRAAVTVLRQLLAGLENDMIAFLKEDILPIYRTLKQIYNGDPDDVMRLQAQLALEELDHNMMNFLFPKSELSMESRVLRLN